MSRPLSVLAILLSIGTAALLPAPGLIALATSEARGESRTVTSQAAANTKPDTPTREEAQAEQELLQLANQSRAQNGLPPLKFDAGLTKAARDHARAMVAAHRLSHQLPNEPPLERRVAAATELLLDQEGENVALDYNAEQGHEHLMLSPPHRANLLHPAYNVAGMGVVRAGEHIYIAQDFGRALPNYSIAEVKDQIAQAVQQARRKQNRPELPRRDLANADDVACSMAHADSLSTKQVQGLTQHFTVMAYTNRDPQTLPDGAAHALVAAGVNSFSIGACYARSPTYPTGVYWIILSLN